MALGFPVATRNAWLNQIVTDAGANAKIRVYSGTRPATGAAITSQTLLAELTGASTFGTVSAGVLTVNAITQDSAADNTGTATWFRVYKSDGTTFVFDGSVGTSGADLNLNTVNLQQGGPVSITSFTITAPNA